MTWENTNDLCKISGLTQKLKISLLSEISKGGGGNSQMARRFDALYGAWKDGHKIFVSIDAPPTFVEFFSFPLKLKYYFSRKREFDKICSSTWDFWQGKMW